MFSKVSRAIKTPIILVMGGPGSGKRIFSSNFHSCEHFSVGDCLRKLIYSNHPQAATVKAQMDGGKLLSDDFIRQLLLTHPTLRGAKPVLMDGFPRTSSQWDMFKTIFNSPLAVINISVSPKTMAERLLVRGRNDDKPEVIDSRITDYFANTRPLALKILSETPDSIDIHADHLTPKEVAEKGIEFLQQFGITPEEYTPLDGVRRSRFVPSCFD